MNKKTWMMLLVPLSIAFSVSLILHFVLGLDVFFINLGTEIIGIIITVFYVSYVLEKNKEDEWTKVDKIVNFRLIYLINSTSMNIREGLRIPVDFLNLVTIDELDSYELHKKVVNKMIGLTEKQIDAYLDLLDNAGWKYFSKNINEAERNIETFYRDFSNRLSPEQIANLLDLQILLKDSLSSYEIIPEYFGLPIGDLPKQTRSISIKIIRSTKKRARDRILTVLKISLLLSNSIDPLKVQEMKIEI